MVHLNIYINHDILLIFIEFININFAVLNFIKVVVTVCSLYAFKLNYFITICLIILVYFIFANCVAKNELALEKTL